MKTVEGLPAERLTAEQRALAERHRSFAHAIARSHFARHPGATQEELLGAAELGLVQAARSYLAAAPGEEERATFETFAFHRVLGAVRDTFRREAKAYAIRRAAEAAALAMAASHRDDGDPLYDDAHATRSQLSEKAAAIQGAFFAGLAAASLEAVGEDHAADAESHRRTAVIVREAVASLPPRDRALIERHYFEHVELKSLAVEIGLSYTTARRVHQDALARLGKRLRARGVDGG